MYKNDYILFIFPCMMPFAIIHLLMRHFIMLDFAELSHLYFMNLVCSYMLLVYHIMLLILHYMMLIFHYDYDASFSLYDASVSFYDARFSLFFFVIYVANFVYGGVICHRFMICIFSIIR